jgi:vacuolar-type H+-ATPase subunit I/STV1
MRTSRAVFLHHPRLLILFASLSSILGLFYPTFCKMVDDDFPGGSITHPMFFGGIGDALSLVDHTADDLLQSLAKALLTLAFMFGLLHILLRMLIDLILYTISEPIKLFKVIGRQTVENFLEFFFA